MKEIKRVYKNAGRKISFSSSATFMVWILRLPQNNWKSELRWLEGEETIYFGNLLEMIMLLQEALEKQGVYDPNQSFRSWDPQKKI